MDIVGIIFLLVVGLALLGLVLYTRIVLENRQIDPPAEDDNEDDETPWDYR